MSIAKYVLFAYLNLAMMLTILNVGKLRKPITPGTAVCTVAITAGLIVLVVIA